VYDGFQLKRGFPMTIKDNIYPSEVDAAVIVNDQLYLFWVLFLKVDLVKSDKKYLY
jgi:hypothetical protein